MKPIDLKEIYELGSAIANLHQVKEGKSVHDFLWTLWSSREELQKHIGDKSILPKSSKKCASDLIAAIGYLCPTDVDQAVQIDKTRVVENYEAYTLTNALSTFSTVLASDFPEVAAYFVEKKGTHDTDSLINHAEEMFSEAIRNRLPELTKSDLKQAGTALAFDLHTAAGFHFLRALESVIRYYCTVVTKQAPKSGSWSAWIQVLEKHDADKAITKMLDHLRSTYRNKIIHPELVLDADDAVVLMGITQSAILLIMKDLQKHQPPDPQQIAIAAAG